MPKTVQGFPQKHLSYDERVKALGEAIRSLPDRRISEEEFAHRCVSFVVGNGFDALSDGTKLTTKMVRGALYRARGITVPTGRKHASGQ